MVDPAPSALRVKVPCNDAADFHARLADHIAANGLRVPAEPRPVGSRLRIALELRNGETLLGDAVVDGHVQLDSRPGLSVRFLTPPSGPEEAVPIEVDEVLPDGGPDEPLAPAPAGGFDPFAGILPPDEPLPPAPPQEVEPFTGSAEILATANRRASRLLRGAVGLALLALALAATGYVIGQRLAKASSPRAIVAARLASADRLVAEGRILGKDGALEQLLAAREVRRDDPGTTARLSHIADLLESLASEAIDRGDLAVASVHLAAAALADPTRESIRAKRSLVAAKMQPAEPRPRTRSRRR